MGTEKSSLLDMFMRVALPVAIGLGVTFWLFSDEFSAESFAAAEKGRYVLNTLKKRYGTALLPQVVTVDMVA